MMKEKLEPAEHLNLKGGAKKLREFILTCRGLLRRQKKRLKILFRYIDSIMDCRPVLR